MEWMLLLISSSLPSENYSNIYGGESGNESGNNDDS